MKPNDKLKLSSIIELARSGMSARVSRAAMEEMLILYSATEEEVAEFRTALEAAIKEYRAAKGLTSPRPPRYKKII